jgi:hypothetical protein
MRTNLNVRRTTGSKIAIVLFFVLLFYSFPASAQCAMCRAALEGENNTAKAEAVNDGIVYLMAIPYLLVAVIGYYIYRTQIGKKKS